MKYLIAIDIDGTLRHDNGIITPYAIETIKKIKDKGHYVVLCTARPRHHAKRVNNEIGGSDLIICLSGAEIYNSLEDRVIHETFIEKKEAEILYNYAIEHDIKIIFTVEDKEYVTKFIKKEEQILLTKNNDFVLKNKVKECMVIDSKDKVITFRNKMKEYYNMNVAVSSFDEEEEQYFIVIPSLANKGYGLKTLSNYLNIKKEQIISFGNDNNDITMFNESNLGIAVANSTKELLEKADIIIESNNEDSVAKYLSKMIGTIL